MKKKVHVHSMDDYAYQSPLRSWNPHMKVVAVLTVLFFCIAADCLWVSLFVVGTTFLFNIGFNRVNVRDYLALTAIPLFFLVMGSAAIAIDLGIGEQGWYIKVTSAGIMKSLGVMMRAFGAVGALYFLTLSTPVSEMISVFRSFHLPKIVVELMYLIYRYSFILMEAQHRMRDAAESRLGYADFRTSCLTFGNSMGNLLVVSLKKAGTYYDAMVSRCYDGDLLFYEEIKPCRVRHVLAAVLYLGIMAGIRLSVRV